MQSPGIALEDDGADWLVETQRAAEIAVQNAFPVIHILLRQRQIKAISVAGRLHVSAGGVFTQHLLDGIARDQMDQQKNDGDNQPDDRDHIEQAG